MKQESEPHSVPKPTEPDDRVAWAEHHFLGKNKALLRNKGIDPDGFELFLRAFKQETVLELWAKNKSEKAYKKITAFPWCCTSGQVGPKRKQGDRQVPEGVYHISVFNPKSKFHLSLGINYPNGSDKILGTADDLGGEIYIHGGCQSIGCIAITDICIREVYVFAKMAMDGGQRQIPVHIFPFHLTKGNLENHVRHFPQHRAFWEMLRPVYLDFQEKKKLKEIRVNESGEYLSLQ